MYALISSRKETALMGSFEH